MITISAQNGSSKKSLLGLFCIPFIIRLIPELISFPYPLGFDTVVFYLPSMVGEGSNWYTLESILRKAPLYYIIQDTLYQIYPDPIIILKVMGPLLYGLLFLVIGIYVKKVMSIDTKLLYLGILISSLSIISLRMSWDLYRNMLGLIFAISTLILLRDSRYYAKLLAIITTFLTVISHELVALYLVFTLAIMSIIYIIEKTNIGWTYFIVFLEASFLFSFKVLRVPELTLAIPVKFIGISKGLNIFEYVLGLTVFIGGLTITLSIFSLKRWKFYREPLIWLSLSLFLLFSVLFGVYVIPPYRIFLMLLYPLTVYGTLSIKVLFHENPLNIKTVVSTVIILAIVMMGVGYLVSTPEHPNPYISLAYNVLGDDLTRDIPTGFLQNTVSLSSIEELIYLVNTFNSIDKNGKLILPKIFLWISYIDGVNLDRNISFENWIKIGYLNTNYIGITHNSTIYVIWWADQDWYGFKLPSEFTIVERNGAFAIYKYEQ